MFKQIAQNPFINVAVVSWFSAQIIKVLLNLLVDRKLVLERFVGAGGMPSSHSALVCSLTIAIARRLGYASPEFALAFCFAAIVMYDAMGVRRAAGEQAKVLNKLVFHFDWSKFTFQSDDGEEQEDGQEQHEEVDMPTKELKEFLGHTPLEVLGGALLGILIALLMPV